MLTSLFACSDERAPAPGVSTGGRPDPGRDGGTPGAPPLVVRPDGGPRLPMADVEITLPFGGAPVTHRITLQADLNALDVHLSIDTTQSIRAEIDALQEDLNRHIVPSLSERVADVSVGVSHFEDFPELPWGFPGDSGGKPPDTPFALLTPVTSDLDAVASAVARLDSPLGFGQDVPESGAEALWQIATGEGYQRPTDDVPLILPFDGEPREGGGDIGGVGFREGALHVVVHVTDAYSHEPADYDSVFPDTHDLQQAAEALQAIQARVLGIVSSNCEEGGGDACESQGVGLLARQDLERMALATGAIAADTEGDCPHGIDGAAVPPRDGQCPLVFDVAGDGSGLADTLVDAIVELVDGIRFTRIHGEASDDPLGFVARVTPIRVEQPQGGPPPDIDDLLPRDTPDGVDDSFVDVRARARLGFDVELQNHLIAPTDREQRFRIVVRIEGDGLTVLEQTLRVIVPGGDAGVVGPDPRASGGDEDAGLELAAP